MIKTWTTRLVGLLLISGFGFIVFPFVVGGTNMQTFCEAIQTDELEKSLLARADDLGYTRRETKNGRLLLIDSRAMGRYICEVSISDGKVAEATYIHNG